MYFITTVSKDDTRCVGYFSKFDDALYIVQNNAGDINEAGCYPYVVIENIKEGIYEYDFNPLWFKYDDEDHKYKSSEKPPYDEEFGDTIGYAIG